MVAWVVSDLGILPGFLRQAFKETGKKPPGVLKTLIGIVSNVNSTTSSQSKCKHDLLLLLKTL